MATWPEARAAKAERLRRNRRLYTPDRLGPKCPVCRTPTVKGLPAVHPCCAEPELMALDVTSVGGRDPGETAPTVAGSDPTMPPADATHVHQFVPKRDGELHGKPRYRNRCADPTCNVRQLETLTERQPA